VQVPGERFFTPVFGVSVKAVVARVYRGVKKWAGCPFFYSACREGKLQAAAVRIVYVKGAVFSSFPAVILKQIAISRHF